MSLPLTEDKHFVMLIQSKRRPGWILPEADGKSTRTARRRRNAGVGRGRYFGADRL